MKVLGGQGRYRGVSAAPFGPRSCSAIPFDQNVDFLLNLLRVGVLGRDQAITQLGPIDRAKGNSQVQLTRP